MLYQFTFQIFQENPLCDFSQFRLCFKGCRVEATPIVTLRNRFLTYRHDILYYLGYEI